MLLEVKTPNVKSIRIVTELIAQIIKKELYVLFVKIILIFMIKNTAAQIYLIGTQILVLVWFTMRQIGE